MVERQQPPETLLTMPSKAEKDIFREEAATAVWCLVSRTRTSADACGTESETPDALARSDRRTSERTQGSTACVNRTSLVQFWSPLEQRERKRASTPQACVFGGVRCELLSRMSELKNAAELCRVAVFPRNSLILLNGHMALLFIYNCSKS